MKPVELGEGEVVCDPFGELRFFERVGSFALIPFFQRARFAAIELDRIAGDSSVRSVKDGAFSYDCFGPVPAPAAIRGLSGGLRYLKFLSRVSPGPP